MAIVICLLAASFVSDGWLSLEVGVKDAEAVIGRPATPGSVAGVARRTTRRTIRRTTIYVASLPKGCSKVNIDGTILYLCGGTYYQAYQGQYVVVNVN
jgi:hypothetical protein